MRFCILIGIFASIWNLSMHNASILYSGQFIALIYFGWKLTDWPASVLSIFHTWIPQGSLLGPTLILLQVTFLQFLSDCVPHTHWYVYTHSFFLKIGFIAWWVKSLQAHRSKNIFRFLLKEEIIYKMRHSLRLVVTAECWKVKSDRRDLWRGQFGS